MRKALNQYKSVSIESDIDSASPYRITQLLMEGAIRFLKQARFAIEKGDFEKKGYFIAKAEAIVMTLAGSIEREHGPELSDNLIGLYDFVLDQVVSASIDMDVEKIDVAVRVLSEIKAGWDAIPEEAIHQAEVMRAEKK